MDYVIAGPGVNNGPFNLLCLVKDICLLVALFGVIGSLIISKTQHGCGRRVSFRNRSIISIYQVLKSGIPADIGCGKSEPAVTYTCRYPVADVGGGAAVRVYGVFQRIVYIRSQIGQGSIISRGIGRDCDLVCFGRCGLDLQFEDGITFIVGIQGGCKGAFIVDQVNNRVCRGHACADLDRQCFGTCVIACRLSTGSGPVDDFNGNVVKIRSFLGCGKYQVVVPAIAAGGRLGSARFCGGSTA